MFRSSKLIYFFIALLSMSLLIYWFFSHDKYLNLTKDEIYFSYIAYYFQETGILYPTYNMPYVGTLESLLISVFSTPENTSLTSIRVGGILINVLALIIIYIYFYKEKITLLIFLLFLAQSSLFLIGTNYAWDINSFLFLFFILFFIVVKEFVKSDSNKFWKILFLLTLTLFASYNHIIFSSLVVSCTLGLFLWQLFNKKEKEFSHFVLLGIFSFCNTVLMFTLQFLNKIYVDFYIERFHFDQWKKLIIYSSNFINENMGYHVYLLFPLVIFLETLFFYRILHWLEPYYIRTILALRFFLPINKTTQYLYAFFCLFVFFAFHQKMIFEVWSGEKAMSVFLSYRYPIFIKTILLISSFFLFFYVLRRLFYDLDKNRFLAFLIFSYFLVFTLYIRLWHVQYYYLISFILFLYTAIKYVDEKKYIFKIGVFAILLSNVVMIQSSLWKVYFKENRLIKANLDEIGNGSFDASSMFSDFKPIIDLGRKHKIGTILSKNTNGDSLQIKYDFYKKYFYPEMLNYKDTAIVYYDYQSLGNGFIIDFPNDKR